jgi:predicted nucleic acid-binding protein
MDVLDTDILIDVQRGHPPALAWFGQLKELPCVPGCVVMELVQDARNSREVEDALTLVAPFPIDWPSSGDCARELTEFSTYHLSHGLGLIDALIAACVVGIAATLWTFNDKHYRPIPGLTTSGLYAR